MKLFKDKNNDELYFMHCDQRFGTLNSLKALN